MSKSTTDCVSPVSSSFKSFEYNSYPTLPMCPCCSAPSTLPAPRISKSRIASLYPEPSSVNSIIAFNRAEAFSDITFSGLKVK